MEEQIMDAIMVLDFVGLVALIIWMRAWQKKHGIFPEKKFALIMIGYWSFFTVTIFAPLFRVNIQVAVVVEVVLLFLWWVIGYPWTRWLYRRFTSSKKAK